MTKTPRIPVVCNECQKKFSVAADAPACPVCQKCGSVDIDVREDQS